MSRARGFTLVELLVVIGIITVLIAILLPSVMKAKRQAERIACAANMRQIVIGLVAYANDQKGFVPAPAVAGTAFVRDADWVHWQPTRNLEESRVWAYIGRSDKVLRCPAGAMSPFDYAYSYALNVMFAGLPQGRPPGTADRWDVRPCKLSSAYHPARKLLLGEPDENGIFDGAWYPTNDNRTRPKTPGIQWHWLSVRHEMSDSRKRHLGSETGRGNVVFADGHWEFIGRSMVLIPALNDPRVRKELPPSE